jgi:WD domain, G-beta repeat
MSAIPGTSAPAGRTDHEDALRRWAAVHAATVPVPGGAAGGLLVLPPREVTPEFSMPTSKIQAQQQSARLAGITTTDGRMRLATWGHGPVHLWDLAAGRHVGVIESGHDAYDCAWVEPPRGGLLLASGSDDGSVRIWDADTGRYLHAFTGHSNNVGSVAWACTPDGQLLLASGGSDCTARVWDADSGRCLHVLTGHGARVSSVAWGQSPSGNPLIATGSWDSTARIWDPETGRCLCVLGGHSKDVNFVAWAQAAGSQSLLATVSDDGTARVWDSNTGQCLHVLAEHGGNVRCCAWERTSAGKPLLATSGRDGTRMWDIETATEIAAIGGAERLFRSIDWVRDRAGNLLFVCPSVTDSAPARVWLVESAPPTDTPASANSRVGQLPAGTGGRLLGLGRGGLWPPLGVLADLVTLTGPGAADGTGSAGPVLCDPGLRVLGREPGIERLRNLAAGEPGWGPDARAALAAFLASFLDIPRQYAPPDGTNPGELRAALAAAVSGSADRAATPPWRAPDTALRAAADSVTGQVIMLLAILGPEACAADPMLPVRLAHRIAELPVLSPRDLRLLAAAGSSAASAVTAAAAMAWSPGTAAVARTGPLTRLLSTELALPRDLLSMRLAEDQVLYRQHRTPAPPIPEPVTVILDTTPPTYGPAATVLRLAAHLIVTTLWAHGRYPVLVTLTDPETVVEMHVAGDLVRIWTSATLAEPGARLAAARRTATGLGQPAVLCTHFQTARDHEYLPGAQHRLITSHQPPERAPAGPGGRWHAHLPPGPDQGQLANAVARVLLTPGRG